MEVGRSKVCSLVAIWGTPPFQNLVIIGILRVSLAEAPILSAPSWKQRSHLLLPESLYFGETSCSGISFPLAPSLQVFNPLSLCTNRDGRKEWPKEPSPNFFSLFFSVLRREPSILSRTLKDEWKTMPVIILLKKWWHQFFVLHINIS